MFPKKKVVGLCMAMYMIVLAYHLLYSALYCSNDQTVKVAVWSVCVLIVLIFFLFLFKSQLDMVVYVCSVAIFSSVTYVGHVLNTLAFAVLIYFAGMLLISLFLKRRYVVVYGTISIFVLIFYSVYWPEAILTMVPSLFLYHGYVLVYILGIILTYFLVDASVIHMDEISSENIRVKSDKKSQNIFWANISNEIRTPMNVINGMSRLLRTENLNVRAREYTDQIENASDMLTFIVNDTLELSALEAGKVTIKDEPYDFYKVISNSIMQASSNIRSDDVSLAYSINPKVPYILVGDNEVLTKILVRLLSNSLIFCEKGQIKLDVEASQSQDIDKIDLLIKVKDDGVGIDEKEIDNIFGGFDSFNSSRTTEQETVGLSLKLCKTLVELLHGSIEVESTLGVGTTFSIHLTQTVGEEDIMDNSILDSSLIIDTDFKSPLSNVLVVDDTPTNLKLISGMIRLFGIEPDNASSGKECIEMMEKTKYDLVFIDYMMPIMNGEDTLKQIKSRTTSPNFMNVPLIALSSKSLQRDRNRFMEMGFDEFISKPIDDKELEHLLRKFLTK